MINYSKNRKSWGYFSNTVLNTIHEAANIASEKYLVHNIVFKKIKLPAEFDPENNN